MKIFIPLFVSYLLFVSSLMSNHDSANHFEIFDHSDVDMDVNSDIKLDLLYLAICHVESRHNRYAKNAKSSALGEAQMLKSYVEDVNRICTLKNIDKKFTLSDRTNPDKCKEMFKILNSHYFPCNDIHKIISKHRGLKGDDLKPYLNTVLNKYNSYLNEVSK